MFVKNIIYYYYKIFLRLVLVFENSSIFQTKKEHEQRSFVRQESI